MEEHKDDKEEQSTGLTEAKLTSHCLKFDKETERLELERRIEALAKAARELGFDLPCSCYKNDEQDLPEWLEALP